MKIKIYKQIEFILTTARNNMKYFHRIFIDFINKEKQIFIF